MDGLYAEINRHVDGPILAIVGILMMLSTFI